MFNQHRLIFQGLFMAPSIVAEALKGATLASKVFEDIGFETYPKYSEIRTDIIQNIIFRKICGIVGRRKASWQVDYCGDLCKK